MSAVSLCKAILLACRAEIALRIAALSCWLDVRMSMTLWLLAIAADRSGFAECVLTEAHEVISSSKIGTMRFICNDGRR